MQWNNHLLSIPVPSFNFVAWIVPEGDTNFDCVENDNDAWKERKNGYMKGKFSKGQASLLYKVATHYLPVI